jgi:hypothetical protein
MVLSWHLPGGTEEKPQKSQARYQASRLRFNPGPLKYNAGMVTIQPSHSVFMGKDNVRCYFYEILFLLEISLKV